MLHRTICSLAIAGLIAGSAFGGTATLNTFQSTSLNRAMTYWVYLPTNYETKKAAGEKFSVIYLLHWWIYSAQGWHQSDGVRVSPRLDQVVDSVSNVIGIAPQDESTCNEGKGTSWWINSTAFGKYGDFVSIDLPAEVNAKYSTYGDAAHNGITGTSMGGFGALHHIRANKNVFGLGYGIVSLTDLSVNSRTGSAYSPVNCVWQLCSIFGGNYWGNSAIQAEWAPIAHAAEYAGIRFGFSSSSGDFFRKDNIDFAAALTAAGITANYVEYPNEAHEYPTPQRMVGILRFLFEDGPAPGGTAINNPSKNSLTQRATTSKTRLTIAVGNSNVPNHGRFVGLDGRSLTTAPATGIVITAK